MDVGSEACPGAARLRAREAGIIVGVLEPGARNAITDVPGVRVGHCTLVYGAGALVPGAGPVRTGVTVILPHPGDPYLLKSVAAVHTINGYGKAFGFEQVRELGLLESPIALTNTFCVGAVADALVRWAVARDSRIGAADGFGSLNVVVGETNDGFLNDLAGRRVGWEQVKAALDAAYSNGDGAPVPEGCVGAGTGTSCFGWKGGIGTASRLVPRPGGPPWTLGALVQTNFGAPGALTVAGVPVGRFLDPREGGSTSGAAPEAGRDAGSVMVVLAVDAPLSDRQLLRLCRRAEAGLARTGSSFGHGSGDFVVAFSTRNPDPHGGAPKVPELLGDEGEALDALFPAAAEAVEEGVLNSLCAATDTEGRDGRVRRALPLDRVLEILRTWTGA